MKVFQVLTVATVTGFVAAYSTVFMLASLPSNDVGVVSRIDTSFVEVVEPLKCDIPEDCHIFKRGTPYMVNGLKIIQGEMLIRVESMDTNVEPLHILSRQPMLLGLKHGTIFMLVGGGDLKSSLVILASGQDKPLDV